MQLVGTSQAYRCTATVRRKRQKRGRKHVRMRRTNDEEEENIINLPAIDGTCVALRSDEAHKDRQLSHHQRRRRRRFPSPRVSLCLPIHLAFCFSFRFNLRRFFFSLCLPARLPARRHIMSLCGVFGVLSVSFRISFHPFHPTATIIITLSFCDAQHFSRARSPIKIKTEYILAFVFFHRCCPHIGRSVRAMVQNFWHKWRPLAQVSSPPVSLRAYTDDALAQTKLQLYC